MSFWSQTEFHNPRHFLRAGRLGTGVLVRLEKVVTVLKFSRSALSLDESSRTVLNFFDPRRIFWIKVDTFLQRLFVSSFFRSLFLAYRRADWSRSQVATRSRMPSSWNSIVDLTRLRMKQSLNFSARTLLLFAKKL